MRDNGAARAVVGAGLATTPTRARALVDAIIAGGGARDVDMRARECVDARGGDRVGAPRLYRVVRGCVARRWRRARACGAGRARILSVDVTRAGFREQRRGDAASRGFRGDADARRWTITRAMTTVVVFWSWRCMFFVYYMESARCGITAPASRARISRRRRVTRWCVASMGPRSFHS